MEKDATEAVRKQLTTTPESKQKWTSMHAPSVFPDMWKLVTSYIESHAH